MEGISIIILDVLLGALLVILGVVLRHYWKRTTAYMDSVVEATNLVNLEATQRIYEGFKGELTDIVEDTVDALDQIYANTWKAASADGKLTEEEISTLRVELVDRVKGNLSKNAYDFLDLSLDNLDDLILDLAESYLDYKRSNDQAGKEAA